MLRLVLFGERFHVARLGERLPIRRLLSIEIGRWAAFVHGRRPIVQRVLQLGSQPRHSVDVAFEQCNRIHLWVVQEAFEELDANAIASNLRLLVVVVQLTARDAKGNVLLVGSTMTDLESHLNVI